MTYLTIAGADGAPRRVDPASFAGLFREFEAPEAPPPCRAACRPGPSALLVAGARALLACLACLARLAAARPAPAAVTPSW